jgi:hypothetical protein
VPSDCCYLLKLLVNSFTSVKISHEFGRITCGWPWFSLFFVALLNIFSRRKIEAAAELGKNSCGLYNKVASLAIFFHSGGFKKQYGGYPVSISTKLHPMLLQSTKHFKYTVLLLSQIQHCLPNIGFSAIRKGRNKNLRSLLVGATSYFVWCMQYIG